MVTFLHVQRSYPPGEEMTVQYQIEAGSDLKTSKRDWVGLFRVGWTSSRDYYTFEWAPEPIPETKEGSVKFAGRRLPPEDGHFYQLCFVSRDGTVRGASAPFQFAPLCVSLDDMELVEITDDSMKSVMVLQKKSKEVESLRRESEDARTELSGVQRSLTAAKTENESLVKENAALHQQLEISRTASQDELATLKTEAEEARKATEGLREELERERRKSVDTDDQLERRLAAKQESEQLLIQQLNQEQNHNKELLAVKENKEQELKVMKERVSAVEGEVVVLMSEGEDLRQQLRIKESQVDDLQRLVGTRGEELELISEKLEAAETVNAELNAACVELRANLQQRQEEIVQQQGSLRVDITAAFSQKDEQIEKLEQELACMQANVAELVGARQQNDQPLHSPALPSNVVDKGAYVALQHAYETFEKYYTDEKSARERVLLQLKNTQKECTLLHTSHQEMVQRVLECKKQYELKAQECIDLQRQLKKEGLPTHTPPNGVTAEHEEMVRNCQTAAEELSIRRKDCDEKEEHIAALKAELVAATRRYQDLEDRFDKKITEKNEEIERQKLVFALKAEELAAVMGERDEQMARVVQLTHSIKHCKDNSSRCCPMCNMKFPLRMTEQDFEKHVHGHFETI